MRSHIGRRYQSLCDLPVLPFLAPRVFTPWPQHLRGGLAQIRATASQDRTNHQDKAPPAVKTSTNASANSLTRAHRISQTDLTDREPHGQDQNTEWDDERAGDGEQDSLAGGYKRNNSDTRQTVTFEGNGARAGARNAWIEDEEFQRAFEDIWDKSKSGRISERQTLDNYFQGGSQEASTEPHADHSGAENFQTGTPGQAESFWKMDDPTQIAYESTSQVRKVISGNPKHRSLRRSRQRRTENLEHLKKSNQIGKPANVNSAVYINGNSRSGLPQFVGWGHLNRYIRRARGHTKRRAPNRFPAFSWARLDMRKESRDQNKNQRDFPTRENGALSLSSKHLEWARERIRKGWIANLKTLVEPIEDGGPSSSVIDSSCQEIVNENKAGNQPLTPFQILMLEVMGDIQKERWKGVRLRESTIVKLFELANSQEASNLFSGLLESRQVFSSGSLLTIIKRFGTDQKIDLALRALKQLGRGPARLQAEQLIGGAVLLADPKALEELCGRLPDPAIPMTTQILSLTVSQLAENGSMNALIEMLQRLTKQTSVARVLTLKTETVAHLILRADSEQRRQLYSTHLLSDIAFRKALRTVIHKSQREKRTVLALEALEELYKTGADFEDPENKMACYVIMAAKNRSDPMRMPDSEIFSIMLNYGLKPDVILYNILIHNAIRYGDSETAQRIYQMMVDNGFEPDGATLSILMKHAKDRKNFEEIRDIEELAQAKGLSNPHLTTDLLHVLYLFPESHLTSPARIYELMLQMYCNFFRIDGLLAIDPFIIEDRFDAMSPSIDENKPYPPIATLLVMAQGYLDTLKCLDSQQVARFYNRFQDLVYQGYPGAVALAKSEYFYNAIIKVMSENKLLLPYCIKAVEFMLRSQKKTKILHDSEIQERLYTASALTNEIDKLAIGHSGLPIQDASDTLVGKGARPLVPWKPIGAKNGNDIETSSSSSEHHVEGALQRLEEHYVFGDYKKYAVKLPQLKDGKGIFQDFYHAKNPDDFRRPPLARIPAPSVITWTILLSGFIRHGQLIAAEKVLKMMRGNGIEPNDVTWNQLAQGYARSQDVGGALATIERMHNLGVRVDDEAMAWMMKMNDQRAFLTGYRGITGNSTLSRPETTASHHPDDLQDFLEDEGHRR
jgi:pentatricopeptide repeat protein